MKHPEHWVIECVKYITLCRDIIRGCSLFTLHTQPDEFWIKYRSPWRWGNWNPFFESGLNFPTGGEIETWFENGVSISPPMFFEIFEVGRLSPVFWIGTQFPHWWGNWNPIQKKGLNLPTNRIWDFIGGEIDTLISSPAIWINKDNYLTFLSPKSPFGQT